MLSELHPEVVAAAKASFQAVWDAGSRIARNRHTVNVAAFLLILSRGVV